MERKLTINSDNGTVVVLITALVCEVLIAIPPLLLDFQ